jgi:hypothetical protein
MQVLGSELDPISTAGSSTGDVSCRAIWINPVSGPKASWADCPQPPKSSLEATVRAWLDKSDTRLSVEEGGYGDVAPLIRLLATQWCKFDPNPRE